LQQLEADNAPPPTGERQQRQPHEGFVERDRTIRQPMNCCPRGLAIAQGGHRITNVFTARADVTAES